MASIDAQKPMRIRAVYPQAAFGVQGSPNGRTLTAAGEGKLPGSFRLTWPVAAHSVPRWNVTMKPADESACKSWPRVEWNTRPAPWEMAINCGSCRPLP